MKSRCLSFCLFAAIVHETNPTNQWMLQMWPSQVVVPQVCFKNSALDWCKLCGTGGFSPVVRFCAVVWVVCLPQVLGDAEKRRQPAALSMAGRNCSRLGHLDWIHKQWMGFGKYVFIYVTFYLWLQRFGYRDPNAWWESYWALKICSNNIELQEPFASLGALFRGMLKFHGLYFCQVFRGHQRLRYLEG